MDTTRILPVYVYVNITRIPHGYYQDTTSTLTAKGLACSQVMGVPQDVFLAASDRDSGIRKTMNMRLKAVIMVAMMMTSVSPFDELVSSQVPRAGLTTRLAAKVADTW